MRWLASALLIALVTSTAWAKREQPDPLRDAQKLVKADKKVEAMKLYGAELALAQKKADIQWQQRVVRAINENIEPYMLKDRAVRVLLTHTLMDALDAKQAYAFVYAGGLAYKLLHEMTVDGSRSGLDKVVAICELQAKRKAAGPYEQAMLDYAQGLQAAEAGTPGEAIRNLSKAFDTTRGHGWAHTAMHVGTELAAQLIAKGSDKGAAIALARIVQLLGPRADAALSADWMELVKSRLKGASDVALKPYNEFLETKPLEAETGKGNESNAKAAGDSKLAESWKKTGKSKPFATATRTPGSYKLTAAFDKKREFQHPVNQTGVTYFFQGGLTVAFWDNRVRLFVADLEGWRAIPPPAYRPYPLFTFTPMGKGSSWGVNRKGQLLVKHPQ